MESSDDEFGDFNFLTSAGTRNQAEYKAKTPIRRKRESSHSDISDGSASDEEEANEVSIVDVPEQQVTVVPDRGRRGRSRRRGTRRKSRGVVPQSEQPSEEGDKVVVLSENETSSPEEISPQEEKRLIKVLWKYEIHRISVPKDGRVKDLLDSLSSEVSIPSEELLLSLEDKPLDLESSLEDIKVIDIISAYKGKISQENSFQTQLELKIQDGHSRESTLVKIHPSETVGGLLKAYLATAAPLIVRDNISLSLDGEILTQEELLANLDLEGGEVLDLVVPACPPPSPPGRGGRRSSARVRRK